MSVEAVDKGLLAELRTQIAPEATDAELAWLANVARHLELDPIAKHVVLIGRWDGRLNREVRRPQITVDGRRFIAHRTGRLKGISEIQWCGPRRYSEKEEKLPLDWTELWDEQDPPYAARCFVYVEGWIVPANGTVRWEEFAQRGKGGRLMPTWEQMPSHMLGKVAETLALRRGFPEVADAISMASAGEADESDLVTEAEAGEMLAREVTDLRELTGHPTGSPEAELAILRARWAGLSDEQKDGVRARAHAQGFPAKMGAFSAAERTMFGAMLDDAEQQPFPPGGVGPPSSSHPPGEGSASPRKARQAPSAGRESRGPSSSGPGPASAERSGEVGVMPGPEEPSEEEKEKGRRAIREAHEQLRRLEAEGEEQPPAGAYDNDPASSGHEEGGG